jgi:hypothetical protein
MNVAVPCRTLFRGSIPDILRIIKLQTEIKHNFGEDESLRFVHVELPS